MKDIGNVRSSQTTTLIMSYYTCPTCTFKVVFVVAGQLPVTYNHDTSDAAYLVNKSCFLPLFLRPCSSQKIFSKEQVHFLGSSCRQESLLEATAKGATVTSGAPGSADNAGSISSKQPANGKNKNRCERRKQLLQCHRPIAASC